MRRTRASLAWLAGSKHRRVQNPGRPSSEQLGRAPGITRLFLAGIDYEPRRAADLAVEVLRVEADIPDCLVDLSQRTDRELFATEADRDGRVFQQSAGTLKCLLEDRRMVEGQTAGDRATATTPLRPSPPGKRRCLQ